MSARPSPPVRNPLVGPLKRKTGAGAHKDKRERLPRKRKHKKREKRDDEA